MACWPELTLSTMADRETPPREKRARADRGRRYLRGQSSATVHRMPQSMEGLV